MNEILQVANSAVRPFSSTKPARIAFIRDAGGEVVLIPDARTETATKAVESNSIRFNG